MDGAEPHGSEASAGRSDAGAAPAADQAQDADLVFTTVVDGSHPGGGDQDAGEQAGGDEDGGDLGELGAAVATGPAGAPPSAAPPPPASAPPPPASAPPPASSPPPSAAVTPPAVEGLADALSGLRHAVRQEFERCAGVLFSHDRALGELNDRMGALVGRLDEVEVRAAALPEAAPPPPAPPPEAAPRTPELYDQALGHILEEVDGLDRRLQAVDPVEVGTRMAALEGRLAVLEPLPAVVQALRTVVREGEETLATEITGREHADGAEPGGAEALEQVAGRLSVLEGRLAPIETLPDDIAALGRIVRRELDAVTSDVQARDQVLRRALQKEIERIQAATGDREEAVREAGQKLELLERRVRGAAQTGDDAVAATTRRLETLESRLVSVDALADDIDTLRAAARRELERLRASTQSHDQSLTETGKRFADLDGRVSRLDSLPGEVQSLRSAMRQEGDRTAVALRSIEERTGEASEKAFRQLRQLADAVTDANERIGGLTSEMQSARKAMRAVEVAVATTSERVDALAAQAAATEPGTESEPDEAGALPGPDAPAPDAPAPAPAG